MTEAEQFLTELESYSKRAMMQPGDSSDMYESMDAFQGVANPAAILRLVGMVRWLASTHHNPPYWIKNAYRATDEHHD